MAGAGYKLFTTGEVLTAAQVNTYLQEQTVMSFADSAARTTALSGVLAEGMMSYLRDTNAVQVYNGSAWVAVGSSSPLTTKGDLYGFSTLDARIPIGTNNQVLTADSAQALGLKWATPSAAAKSYTLLNAGGTALTAAGTITVTGITGDDLMILITGASSASASADIYLRFNTIATAKYGNMGLTLVAPTAYAATYLSRVTNTVDSATTVALATMSSNAGSTVAGYCRVFGAKSTGSKPYSYAAGVNASTGDGQVTQVASGVFTDTAAITSVSIVSSVGNFDAGTIYVYEAQ